MSYDHPLPPGNFARAVPQYRAKSGLRSPSRPNTARSYADDTWPGVSYPSGDRTCVERAQGTGLGLHPRGRRTPAAVQRGQDVHGVVPGVEEDSAPQIVDPVRLPLGDPDLAAARSDVLQLPLLHRVFDAGGQGGQHREGEQRLERAGRRQRAMRVVRGQHLAGAGVGHQPGQRGDVRYPGHPTMGPDLDALAVQERRRRRRHPRRTGRGGLGTGGGRDGSERQDTGHAEGAGGDGCPGPEFGDHMINVGICPRCMPVTGP